MRFLCCFTAGILASTSATPAAEPVWNADYITARKASQATKKPILVVIGTQQCVYCRKLESITFADADVKSLLGDSFVLLKIDANLDPEFARAMRVTIYPTTVIADADGKIYAYLSGFLGAEDFRTNAKKALALMPELKAEPFKDKPAVVTSLKKDIRAVDAPPASVPATRTTDIPVSANPTAELLATAKAHSEADRSAEAALACETILRGQPNSPEAEPARALLMLIQSDVGKLRRVAEQLDEKFANTYFLLAEGLHGRGRFKEAAELYEKIVRLAPQSRLGELSQNRLIAYNKSNTRVER